MNKENNAMFLEQLKRIATCLDGLDPATRIVISAHIHPDGDAYGSMLGLCLGLRSQGFNAFCTGFSELRPEYAFLQGMEYVISHEELQESDFLIVLDCNGVKRLPEQLQESFPKIGVALCIDHHMGYKEGFAREALIDEGAAATSELVYQLLAAMPRTKFDAAIAEALWVGIVTDTGRYAYSCTSPLTLEVGAKLLAEGVRSEYINEQVYGSQPLKRLKLQQRLISSITVEAQGKIAIGFLTSEDFAAEGCVGSDSENFVDVVRSIRGVEMAAFIRQPEPSAPVNISLRTKEPYDAAAICAKLGGGGHVRAAGASIKDATLEQVRAKLFEILASLVERS